MSLTQQLHQEAMEVANEAQSAFLIGDVETYQKLSAAAFIKEKAAAMLLEDKFTAEPTRSVLFRSAAQLAINCGQFQEAERLIAQGLLGNPPIELRLELRNLNKQILSALEISESLILDLSPDYLNQLRLQALHILVQPKNPTHLTAVHLNDVIEVLKKIKESFLNFFEIDFWKNFDQNSFQEPEKVLATLRAAANPLIVNSKFSSFAASISSDLVVMAKQYSPEINDWKRAVFTKYRAEVFEPANYESEKAAAEIASPYSSEERRRIFQPIVDLFKEGNKYSLTLTDENFKVKKKAYSPVNTRVKNILIPALTEDELKKDKSVFQILGIGDTESKNGKLLELSRSEMESASFSHKLHHVRFEKEELFLHEEIELIVRYEKPVFYIEYVPLNLEISSNDFESVIKNFQFQFIKLYETLQNRTAESLNADEQIFKAFFHRTVFVKSK